MFEKEAEARVRDYIIKSRDCLMQPCKTLEDCKVQELEFDEVVKLVKEGAEFGYKLAHEEIDYLNKHWRSEEERKANEWHFVKDGDLPKGEYPENEKVYAIFKNNSYYIVDRAAVKNYDDLIAWTELPKLPTELSKKWVDNYEDYQNASNDITFSQYPVYRGK